MNVHRDSLGPSPSYSAKGFILIAQLTLIALVSYQHFSGPMWNYQELVIDKENECSFSGSNCGTVSHRKLQSLQEVKKNTMTPERKVTWGESLSRQAYFFTEWHCFYLQWQCWRPGWRSANTNTPPMFADLIPRIPINPDRLFYNRVPKCGSHTFLDVINVMAVNNNFTFERAPEYMSFHVETYYQLKFVDRLKQINPPMMYERHIHFVDFAKFGQPQPVYINLIRDPLQRMVSWYYFRRYQEGHEREMPEEMRNRSFDACVRGNFSECTDMHGDDPEQGYFKIIPFFCGQEDHCRQDGEWALQTAIRNVDKHYLVVGVTEQFGDFVGALEHMLPSYFKGGNQFFQREGANLKARHRTVKKEYPSEDVVQIMTKKMSNEYKFYKFVRHKFNGLIYGLSLKDAAEKTEYFNERRPFKSRERGSKT